MTKKQFLGKIVPLIPRLAAVWFITQAPHYGWQNTWYVMLHCEKACFKTRLVRGGKTSTTILDGARGKESAEKKAMRYQRWFMNSRTDRLVEGKRNGHANG